MKNALPAILVVALLAMGSFAVYEYQQVEHLQTLVSQMKKDAAAGREENDSTSAELRKLKDQTKNQKATITQLEKIVQDSAKAPADGAKAAESSPAEGGGAGEGGFMKGLSKMFTDPKMKDAMRGQQAAAIQMMYGDLAKTLGLSPDVAQQVLALLSDRQMELSSQSMKALSQGTGKEALTAVAKENQATKASYDEQIKGVLGDDGFKKFKDYEKTLAERVSVDQYQKQLSATGIPLDATQSQGLLAIMQEERAKTPSLGNDPAAQAKMLESDEAMNTWTQAQEEFNRRVLERARTVLSPDQLLAFEKAQQQMLNMQKMGMQMSRQMFKGNK